MSLRSIRGPFRFNDFVIVTATAASGADWTVINESVVIFNKGTGAPSSLNLPPSAKVPNTSGQVRCVIVIDGKGDSQTNPITVSTQGSDTVNGGASFVMASAYGVGLFFDQGNGQWTTDPGSAGMEPAADNLTAHAGGGQTNAYPISTSIARFTTVASANDSCSLPLAEPGAEVTVINAAASHAMQVFASPLGTDTINGTPGATGISLPAGKTAQFVSASTGSWHYVVSS